MKNIEKRYQCSFHGFKEKSNRKTTWLSNILSLEDRMSHPPISDDALIGVGKFPTHFFGQTNPSIFDHLIWKV